MPNRKEPNQLRSGAFSMMKQALAIEAHPVGVFRVYLDEFAAPKPMEVATS